MEKNKIIITIMVAIICNIVCLYVFWPEDYEYKSFMASPTTISFKEDTLNLGTILYNSEKSAVFQFTNTGGVPLLIRDVRTSCGCISVKWKKCPVKPGETGEIKVAFKPNSLGVFLKTIEVYCNTLEQVINLKLRGNVIENRIL